jgi:hypothetical protein
LVGIKIQILSILFTKKVKAVMAMSKALDPLDRAVIPLMEVGRAG